MSDDDFLAEFYAEAKDGLDLVERHLLRLESHDSIDQSIIDEIFRAVHSIKGGAGFLGLDTLVAVAHQGESLMDGVRNGLIQLTSHVADALLAAVDGMRAIIQDEEVEIDVLCERLKTIIQTQLGGGSGQGGNAVPASSSSQASTAGTDFIETAQPPLVAEYDITATAGQLLDAPDCQGGIVEGFEKIGDVVAHAGTQGPKTERVTIRVRTPLPAEIVASLYHLNEDQITPAAHASAALEAHEPNPPPPVAAAAAPKPAAVSQNQQGQQGSTPAAAATKPPARERAPSASSDTPQESSVRVGTRFLDELLEATGNMVMARNQMLQRYQFQDDISFAVLSRCITEMHKSVVQQRMQGIASLFERFRRPVRDLANKLGKDVEFQADGGDIELDRTIIEAFADPLNHMVRNAVDHAIEAPEERLAKGKSQVGRIILRAYHQSGEVIVEIEDDGAGIDHEKVREKAIAKGLITADRARAMRPREILHLIFAPGFSTKDQSTDISGRGVGMDVVKTNVERIGGAVEVHTNPGAGTVFAFRLPLTQTVVSSSLISAIVVEVAGQRFVLPQTAINEIIQVDPQDPDDHIKQLDGEDVYQLRDQVLAIVHLEDCLSLQRTFRHPRTGEVLPDRRSRIADRRQLESPEAAARYASQRSGIDRRRFRQTLIVLEFRRALFGVLVDCVVGVEEVVVRSTPKLFGAVPGFCGHTVLGDGSVTMMLDVAGIVAQRGLRLRDQPEHNRVARSALKTAQQMITFENAPGEFFAIPLMMVTLIEHIQAADIRRVGSREFYQLKDTTVPLIRLEHHLDVSPHHDSPVYHLIMPARVAKPVGILAGGSLRIADFSESFDAHNDSSDGVVGTAYYEGQVVTLLDIYALVERAMPESFTPPERKVIGGTVRLLLAEDNRFFSKLVCSYLDIPGLDVTLVEDGQEAWDLLHGERRQFDLIVSDIEMPRMNGFELVQRIKSDPALRHLPVLALTSLADEDSRRRGMKAGFDDYAVKIDKQDLLDMIHRLIEQVRGLNTGSK